MGNRLMKNKKKKWCIGVIVIVLRLYFNDEDKKVM